MKPLLTQPGFARELPGPRRFSNRLILILALSLGQSAGLAQPTSADAPRPEAAGPSAGPSNAAFVPDHKTSFNEVTRQLDPGGSVYLYLATDQWLARLSAEVSRIGEVIAALPDIPAAEAPQVKRVVDMVTSGIRGSGIEALDGVGVSSAEVAPGMYRSKFIFHHPPAEGKGLLWNLFGAQAHPLRSMDMLPNTTALGAFGDLDLARAWDALARALSDSGIPALAEGVHAWEQAFEQFTKLPWADFLASFGGEAGLILTLDDTRKVSLPIGPEPLELPEPGLVLAVRVKNDLLYERLSGQLKEHLQAVPTEEQGLKLCAAPSSLPLPVPVQPAVASAGGYVFVASSPELVRAVVSARNGGAAGLARSAQFQGALSHLPAQGNLFCYVDKRFSEVITRIRSHVAAAGGSPAAKAFIQGLLVGREPWSGLVLGGRTSAGWQTVAIGNRDCSGALVLAPAMAAVAVPAAMLLPALSQAKGRAQQVTCSNNLKQIGLGFRIWAVDNQDRFPFNVPAEKGGTLEACARGQGGFDQNSFRHFQVMSNELSTAKILVCPADTSHQPAANFASLQADNVTYQVRSGPNIKDTQPQEVLARCPIHGLELLCDGSVRRGASK